MKRIVHYLNQFFGQIGGEDHAGVGPSVREQPVGPGLALQAAVGDQAKVVATIICGDNYFAEQPEKASSEVLDLIRSFSPDLVFAGPAFNAGRYGPACAAVCKAVQEDLNIPAITGMFPENPGAELFRKEIICVGTGSSAAGMRAAVATMAAVGLKLAAGKPLGTPEEEGILPRGIRRNLRAARSGAERAVDMLLDKLSGNPYKTELPMPVFEAVPPAPPVEDIRHARIALVTEGGIVPRGNPDKLESARATKYLRYSIAGLDGLEPSQFQSVHGGYSNVAANEDPDRVLPVDALRECVKDGEIGSMADYFFTTTGNGTSMDNSRRFGREIAEALKADGVDGVILTST